MMTSGDLLTLRVEKPAAGGRMIARHDGAVVLVAAAIPGELVEARIERVQKTLAWAVTTKVLEPSPDRVDAPCHWACGGTAFGHVAYLRQLELKRDIIRDAFARLGKMPLEGNIDVMPSPALGYRMRARLHFRDGAAGFFREGTHDLCEPGPTGQLSGETLQATGRLCTALAALGDAGVREIQVSENVAGSERAVHLELAEGAEPSRLGSIGLIDGITGLSAAPADARRALTLSGDPTVTDMLSVTDGTGTAATIRLGRHARAFFQGNRFLLEPLVARVASLTPPGPVLDLYAGVGLFSVALAALGRGPVTAVEGDRIAALDLKRNATTARGAVNIVHEPVEVFTRSKVKLPGSATVLVDPPRTGMSRQALQGILRLMAPRIIYVSCDVATLARDARAIVDAGYTLEHLEAVDLFPNTAHVETLVSFSLPAGLDKPLE